MRCLSLLFLLLAHLGCLLAQPGLTSYTYWYNNQVNQAVTTPVSGPVFDQQLSLSTASLTPGLHTLHFFATDATGKRSAVESRYFFKNDNLKIARYEYWFDNQPGQPKVVEFNPPSVLVDFPAHLDSLPSVRGLAVFNIRFQDTRGAWSPVLSRFFFNNGGGNRIVAYKYWFDANTASAQVVTLPSPVAVFDEPIEVVAGAPNGQARTVHFQFLDELGRWGAVESRLFTNNGSNVPVPPSIFRVFSELSHVSEPGLAARKTHVDQLTNSNNKVPVKICADGTRTIRIEYENLSGIPNQQIGFRIQSSIVGRGEDYSGRLDIPIIQGNRVSASFQSPTFVDGPNLYRNDAFEVINKVTGEILYSYPIHFYRAPIVAMHGLWGDASAFNSLKSYVLNDGYLPSSLFTAHTYPNAVSFFENRGEMKKAIIQALRVAKHNGFACGAVDVIGHSMGGLMARQFIEGTDYDLTVRSLITINTPHSGSQAADFLFSNKNGAKKGKKVLEKKGRCVDCGSVNDLMVGNIGNGIDELNSQVGNVGLVPVRAILTVDSDVPFGISWDSQGFFQFDYTEALIKIIVRNRGERDVFNPFLNDLFDNQVSDLIVSMPSQIGGLLDGYYYYNNNLNINHTQSPSNTTIIEEILRSLKLSPIPANGFSLAGFNPPQLSFDLAYKNGTESDSLEEFVPTDSLYILTPQSGDVYIQGQTMTIQVSGDADVKEVNIVAGNFDWGLFASDSLSNPGTCQLVIPDTALGPMTILAFGYDVNGEWTAFDEVSVVIEPSAPLDSVKADPQRLYVPKGGSMYFDLFGFFGNGRPVNLPPSSLLSASTLHPSIATYQSDFQITGVDTGSTRLVGTYNGKPFQVDVTVYYDATATSISDFDLSQQPTPSLTLIPNPNSGTFRLSGENPIAGPATLQVLAPDGRLICRQQVEWLPAGRFEHKVTLPPTPEGLYLLTLTTTHRSFSGKVVLKDQ